MAPLKNEAPSANASGARNRKSNRTVNAFKAQHETRYSRDEIEELLGYIAKLSRETRNREVWLKIISGVVNALGEGEALPMLTRFFPDEKPNETETVIRSLKGRPRCGAGTLIRYAEQGGLDASAFNKRHYAAQQAAPKPAFRKRAPETVAPVSPELSAPSTKPVRLGRCSLCESLRRPESVKETELLDVLKDILAEKWIAEIRAVRAGKMPKETLPQCCAFGVYKDRRADENLRTRSGFIVLDYDGKDNARTDFGKLRRRLAELPFVAAVFTSPSGDGLKALVRVPDEMSAAAAFELAANVLAPLGGKLDAQSAARKHFIVSADAGAYVNSAPLAEIPPLAPLAKLPPAALGVIFGNIVERFFFAGKDRYFLQDKDAIKELCKADAMQEFEIACGVEKRVARRALYDVRKCRYVARVEKALTCRRAGLHRFNGESVLVLTSPRFIETQSGGVFPTVRRLVETVFTRNKDASRFLAWLQVARKRFRVAYESNGETVAPVPLLMLLGLKGAGKDLLFQTLIRPCLGDRNHANADTFPQEKPWLGALLGSECILASEMTPDLRDYERARFTATIKQILGGSGYNAERKGADGFAFRGQHFMVLLANIDEGGNCAGSCPEPSEDFTDKFIALSPENPDAVKAAFPSEKTKERADAIRRELPAFLHWLENDFRIPDAWKDERFGLKGYCSPEAEIALHEVSPANNLDGMLRIIARRKPELVDKKLSSTILGEAIHQVFNKEIPCNMIGKWMNKLIARFPALYGGGKKSTLRNFYLLKRALLTADEAEEADVTAEQTEARRDVSPFEGLPF